MLSKQNRLKKKEVENVLKKGKAYRGFFLILKYCGTDPKEFSRFAALVPMKVSKKAAQRNRIKRLIRENLRKRLPRIKDGFDGIFMAMPPSLEKDYWEIGEEIEQVLRKAKLVNPKQ